MLRELTDEISGTGVQAGWIKLSAGDDGLTPTETKILWAAARAAKATGSVIGSHTIKGDVVRDQLDILDDVGVEDAAVALPGAAIEFVAREAIDSGASHEARSW